MKISAIKPNPSNPRFIKDDKFKKLVKSLREFPQMMELRPIVVDENNIIQGGNMRYLALQEIGYKEIPDTWVKQGKDLTADKWREFVIKDNVGFGEWDFEALANEWDEEKLQDWGLDFPKDWGNGKKEVEDDDFDETKEVETDIKFGDYFEIGRHRLLCGDSTIESEYYRILNGEKADLIFTDPPYDLEDNYSKHIFNSAKEDCHIFIMNSDRLLIDNVNNGLMWFRRFFSVDFRVARLVSNNQPMTRVDLIAEFCKGKTKFINLKDGFSTLIECSKIHNKNENLNFGHNQAKRIDLSSIFIQHYSKENEIVFDPFGGSGSTMAACEQLSRNCYMIELDPKNCQRILNRMQNCYNLQIKKQSNVLVAN